MCRNVNPLKSFNNQQGLPRCGGGLTYLTPSADGWPSYTSSCLNLHLSPFRQLVELALLTVVTIVPVFDCLIRSFYDV